mmetsp:Transcript_26140/g.65709  ORF Transcript_26140/g.65709 Transcript_26140/m.65709 type:complete len:337 (-) Transcript_26140:536-1546(-)
MFQMLCVACWTVGTRDQKSRIVAGDVHMCKSWQRTERVGELGQTVVTHVQHFERAEEADRNRQLLQPVAAEIQSFQSAEQTNLDREQLDAIVRDQQSLQIAHAVEELGRESGQSIVAEIQSYHTLANVRLQEDTRNAGEMSVVGVDEVTAAVQTALEECVRGQQSTRLLQQRHHLRGTAVCMVCGAGASRRGTTGRARSRGGDAATQAGQAADTSWTERAGVPVPVGLLTGAVEREEFGLTQHLCQRQFAGSVSERRVGRFDGACHGTGQRRIARKRVRLRIGVCSGRCAAAATAAAAAACLRILRIRFLELMKWSCAIAIGLKRFKTERRNGLNC